MLFLNMYSNLEDKLFNFETCFHEEGAKIDHQWLFADSNVKPREEERRCMLMTERLPKGEI